MLHLFHSFLPFSVHHQYDGDWADESTTLKTCNPHGKIFVSSSQPPQELARDEEIVFTYDVEFKVSSQRSTRERMHGGWILLTAR